MKKILVILITAVTAFTCVISASAEVYPDFSINDVTAIQMHIVGYTVEIDNEFAEANGDGIIDVKDVTYRQKELAKIPPYYTEPTTAPEIPGISDDMDIILGEDFEEPTSEAE